MKILRYKLDNVKENHLRKVAGRSVKVFNASTSAAAISVAFEKGHQEEVPMQFPAMVGRDEDFDRVWLSHDAQPGQWVDLAFLEAGESLESPVGDRFGPPVHPIEDIVAISRETTATSYVDMYEVEPHRSLVVDRLAGTGPSGSPGGTVQILDELGAVLFTWLSANTLAIEQEIPIRFVLGPGYKVRVKGDGVANTTAFHLFGRLF